VPALIAALKDKQTDVRVAVVGALGEMGTEGKEAAVKLARMFHDPSVRVREHVREALAQIGPAAIEPLCDALGDDKPEVRLDAIKTIALFGPAAKKAVPTLRRTIKDEDHRIRAASAEALGKMELDGEDAVPELLAALRDKKIGVQSEAVTALVLLTSAGVPGLLQKIREADRKGRWAVPVAVAQVVDKVKKDFMALVKDLRDKDPQVRTRAAITLGELGPKAQPALPALLKLLDEDDPQLRLTAALVIARIERQKAERTRVAQKMLRDFLKPLMVVPPPLKAQQVRMAMNNPELQSVFHQIVMTYIANHTGTGGGDDQMFDTLGPEAVPALVDGINFVAFNRIGFC
jgi:HEAT repeat protein